MPKIFVRLISETSKCVQSVTNIIINGTYNLSEKYFTISLKRNFLAYAKRLYFFKHVITQ